MEVDYKEIVVAGGFDPIHAGHIDHIRKAKALGSWLTVITHPDEIIKLKKGYCLVPLKDRLAILKSMRWVDSVFISIDDDGTVAKTLEIIKPHIFAKGGDRIEGNMPENEIAVCEKYGIKIETAVRND